MPISLSNKLNRVLKLLVGLRNPQPLGVLKSRGFTQQDLDEGWKLLRTATDVRVDAIPAAAPLDPSLLDRLDAWENRWYQTIYATLERHYPELCAKVFANLQRTSGAELLITVPVLLRRLRDLDGQGDDGKKARELLVRRGLTDSVIGEASKLLEASGTPALSADPTPSNTNASQAAEDAVWAWYKEWSQILRVEIKDGRLLRELGLTRTVQRTVVEEVDDDLGEDPPATSASKAVPAAAVNGHDIDTSRARADLKGGSPFAE